MRKSFKLQDLGCANCASKMEDAITKIDGVNNVNISFMTSKMMLDVDPDMLDDVLAQAQDAIHKYEPECEIVR